MASNWSVSVWSQVRGSLALGIRTYEQGQSSGSTISQGFLTTEVGSNLIRGTSIEAALPRTTNAGTTLLLNPSTASTEFLFWAAGNVQVWNYEIAGVPLESVTRLGEGHSAYYWDGSEAASGYHAHATIDGMGVAVSNATYRVNVEHRFYGIAGRSHQMTDHLGIPSPLDDEITHTRPNGDTERCFCFARGWESGEHTLHWTGTNVHWGGITPVVLTGVDVDFPAFPE